MAWTPESELNLSSNEFPGDWRIVQYDSVYSSEGLRTELFYKDDPSDEEWTRVPVSRDSIRKVRN